MQKINFIQLILISILISIFSVSKNINSQTVGKYIVLDAGHGGTDPGAPGYNGAAYPDEKDFNLSTLYNADILCSTIGLVVATRLDDITLDFNQRSDIAVGNEPDGFGRQVMDINDVSALVSIHFNSPSTSARGTQVYAYTDRGSEEPTQTPENDTSSSCQGLIFAGSMIDNVLYETEREYYRNGQWVFFDAQPNPFNTDGIWGNNWNIFTNISYGKSKNKAVLLVEFEFITNPDVWLIVEPIGVYYNMFYHRNAGYAILRAWDDYENWGLDPYNFSSNTPCQCGGGDPAPQSPKTNLG